MIGDEQMAFGNSSYASFDKSWIHWIHLELDLWVSIEVVLVFILESTSIIEGIKTYKWFKFMLRGIPTQVEFDVELKLIWIEMNDNEFRWILKILILKIATMNDPGFGIQL